jgi:leucyl aminopeptidase
MITKIILAKNATASISSIIFGSNKNLDAYNFNEKELKYILSEKENDKKITVINHFDKQYYIINNSEEQDFENIQKTRVLGSNIMSEINKNKNTEIDFIDFSENETIASAFIEGLALSNYQFSKYFSKEDERRHTLETINVVSKNINLKETENLNSLIEGVYLARDLSNEPYSALNSVQLSKIFIKKGKEADLNVEILNKKQIETLKMGGLLAVNKGSAIEPTFSIIEWKPENHKNEKPYILVGKGIVFDSGGYSIKPTPNSMDLMKHDMAGAASVFSAMYVIAKQKLPIHVIALIPATDNAVDAKSYVPGDIIKMHNGLNVEVLNTDAEGRLILADALSYAKKYNPQLVIDIATLTGAQVVAIGHQGTAILSNADEQTKNLLKESGNNVFERLVELPLWEEYGELIKSSIADIKNIGGSEAGPITAGKFLEKFTDYPWAHLDIAGPSIYKKQENYVTEGASGVGVRLFADFFKKISF